VSARRGRTSVASRIAACGIVACALACAIPDDDLLPGIGAPCDVDAALCPIEHTCLPDAPGKTSGLCAPVADFGSCKKPTWPAGRIGETAKSNDVTIDDAADQPRMDNIRLVKGSLRVQHEGTRLELDDLCNFRTLQHTGDSLIISNTSLTTLDGLQSLTSVVNGIAITQNPDLESLAGLANLVKIDPCTIVRGDDGSSSAQIFIAKNDALTKTEIERFIDELEARLGTAPQVEHCGNGPFADQDEMCGVLANQAANNVQNGNALCQ
jgi:hypothetical protein